MKKWKVLALSVLTVVAAGCIDDRYDLSDIDTTSRFTVNDLVVPMNLDEITLKSVIEIEEDSKLQIFTDASGRQFYAVMESGEFDSDPVFVKEMTSAGPVLDPVVKEIGRIPAGSGAPVAQGSASYLIETSGRDFVYNVSDIDGSIHSVESVKVRPMDVVLTLSVPDVAGVVRSTVFEDLKIKLTPGLTVVVPKGDYDPQTGILTIDRLEADGAEVKVKVTVMAIDMAANGSSIDYDRHSLDYAGRIEVSSGVLTVSTTGGTLPQSINFTTAYDFADMVAIAFSGEIDYRLSGVEISDVDLSDIPDFLAGEGTDISLVNPQIYIGVSNPVGASGLECRTGLTVEAMRDGEVSGSYTIDNPYFTIPCDKGVGPYSFCLSPSAPAEAIPGYSSDGLLHVGFTSLSDVLAGNGLPTLLGIELNEPCIPLQLVRDFSLGVDIEGVKGKYDFFAPLALNAGSTIAYTDTNDGWSDEDVDAMTIEKFELTATASTDLPLAVRLTAVVLDKEGNAIDAELSSVELPANAKDFPFTIALGEGQTVTGLDGIRFTAHVKASATTPLSPDQAISLKKLKGKVSGYYTKEL